MPGKRRLPNWSKRRDGNVTLIYFHTISCQWTKENAFSEIFYLAEFKNVTRSILYQIDVIKNSCTHISPFLSLGDFAVSSVGNSCFISHYIYCLKLQFKRWKIRAFRAWIYSCVATCSFQFGTFHGNTHLYSSQTLLKCGRSFLTEIM